MSASTDYTDLLIRISAPRSDTEQHAVEATINGDSFFFGGRLNLNEEKLLANTQDNRAYGRVLWEALFSEPIERAYHKAKGIAETDTSGRLRLRLKIDPDAANLHVYRWERLVLPVSGRNIPLSVSSLTPFSRFISRESAINEPLTKRPVRMVVVVSSPSSLPSGYARIDVKQEIDNLRRSLQGAIQTPGKLQVTILPGIKGIAPPLRKQLEKEGFAINAGATTLETVQEQLFHCDLFHFIGHGVFVPEHPAGSSALFLEKQDGTMKIAKDDEIIARLGDGSKVPRLVFLAACESAKRSADSSEAFVALGPKLVQAGVPAVVGMQDLVPMQLAQQLTAGFYKGLLDHGIIDQALNDARLLLLNSGNADWSIPVLFMRIRSGRLFALDLSRTLLKRIVEFSDQFFANKEPPLPIDVIRVSGNKDQRNLLRLEFDTIPGDDFMHAFEEIFDNNRDADCHTVVLLGSPGMAKSTQLKLLAGHYANRTLNTPDSLPIIPVYTHLSNYFKLDIGFQDSFHSFLLKSLQQFAPEFDDKMFTEWLQDPQSPTFLFLIDGSDRLDDNKRTAVLEQFDKFAKDHPKHRYLLTCDPFHFSSLHFQVSDYLIVKPISQARLRAYLHELPDKRGRDLYHKLEKGQLFDLASIPWILVKILTQVRRGIDPHSRSGVLANLVEDMLAMIPSEKGLRNRADTTLTTLAWEMQRQQRIVLSIADTFQIMDPARGNREYLLEDLLSTLFRLRILAPVGDNSIRFAYPGLQAWFSAQALRTISDKETVLDNITATLGRLSRMRWWEDTLVLLAGSIEDVNSLLRLILYGGRITEGDRLFLAARCIQEAGSGNIAKVLLNQVINALIWLSNSSNEPLVNNRQRAIDTLGLLQAKIAVPHLVKLVMERVRINWLGKSAFEYSSVRLTAVDVLSSMKAPTRKYIVKQYPKQYTQLLKNWFYQDISALKEQLTGTPATHQAIAAFVLANIGSRPATEVLLKTFQQPGIGSVTRWAITDALLRVKPAVVIRNAILPFLDKKSANAVNLPEESWKKRQHWYERLVYLIGNIKPADPRTDAFLERCLFQYTGVWLTARAFRAIGAIGDTSHKNLFQELALGDFSNIAIGKLQSDDVMYLRNAAIDALADIGDRQTLALLQQQDDWSKTELQAAYHHTSEKIAWRLFDRSHSF